MKKFFIFFFLLLVIINIASASWYVYHKDINFSSDIARDFLLLNELNEKKLILIGPRSSVSGLFHGPLWLYLTYPGYLLGNGNPVTVGWYWIFLISCFFVSYYFIAKKMFDRLTAVLFVLMSSLYLIYHANGLYNPHGALFLLPIFFFFFIRYTQTLSLRFLLLHLLTTGAIIQFQMAIGLPFLFLSIIYLTIFAIKHKKKIHLLSFFILIIPLSTFILFDIKHDFLLTHAALRHIQTSDSTGYFNLLKDRLNIMIGGVEFLRFGPNNGTLYVSIFFWAFLLLQIKSNKKYKSIYVNFLYFYVGFYIVSILNRYALLYFYTFPLFIFVFLIFASLATSKYRIVFLAVFFGVYLINLAGIINHIKTSESIIGKSEDSWKFLFNAASKIYEGKEKEFGYFVYSPDILGYGPKYAMAYTEKLCAKTAHSFQKNKITYLLIAPPPSNNPYMKDEWWRKNQVNIKSEPLLIINFTNGYKIEKYLLKENEINVPFDPSINPGIHFR